MQRDDALSGHFQADLDAIKADPQTADVFEAGLAERFLELQETEARKLLRSEYRRPVEVRERCSVLRGEAIHHAFARLCAEAGHERRTPLRHVAGEWSTRARANRQLDALIAGAAHGSTSSPQPSNPSESSTDRILPLRRRRRAPATWDWTAATRPDSTYDRMRLYHSSAMPILMSHMIF
ncbi:MAG: hypothetical protein ABEK03_08160 [Candidatus Bipolaricaulia bacterium]